QTPRRPLAVRDERGRGRAVELRQVRGGEHLPELVVRVHPPVPRTDRDEQPPAFVVALVAGRDLPIPSQRVDALDGFEVRRLDLGHGPDPTLTHVLTPDSCPAAPFEYTPRRTRRITETSWLRDPPCSPWRAIDRR